MASGRVQVNDLSEPERLSALPIKRDTFAQPAQAPIDNSLERLSHALGYFNQNLQAYGARQEVKNEKARREAEKAHIAAGEAEIARWEMATESNAQVQAYRNGQAPLQSDVLLESVHKKKWASLEGEALAADVQNSAIADGLGTEGFNPEQYVLDKTRPYLERLGGHDELVVPFASAAEQVRNGLRKLHETKLAESRLLKDQSIVEDELDRAFDSAVKANVTDDPDFFVRGMGTLYQAFGPRMKGGSMDLNYDIIDEQMLKVLERKAEQSPEAARAVFSYLDGTRPSVDGGGGRFALKDVAKYKPQIERIEEKARKTLASDYDARLKSLVTAADAEALDQADGSFFSLDEFRTFNDYSQKDFAIDTKSRKENAVAAYVQYAKENDIPDAVVLDKFMRNGIEHPTMFAELRGVYAGIGNTTSGFDPNAPDQMDKVAKAGETYRAIVQKNPAYAAKFLSEKERDFYDVYALGVTILKRSPQEAATMAVLTAQPENSKNLSLNRDNVDDIKRKVKKYGQSGWFNFFSDGVTNQGELFDRTVTVANALYRTGRMSSDEAVEAAHEYLKENSVNIHGRALLSPYILKDDEPKVDVLLGAAFEQHKASLRLRGVTSADELSIQPLKDDLFLITGINGTPLVGSDGRMMHLTLGQIQAARKRIAETEAKKAREHIVNQRGRRAVLQEQIDTYAPFSP